MKESCLTPASPQTSQPLWGSFVIQADAFSNINYAQILRKKLEQRGYHTYIRLVETDEKERLFKVLIGKFADRKEAENFSEKIKKVDNLDVFVTPKPPKGKFAVQTGAFSDIAYAKDFRRKLEERGFNAYIIFSISNKGEKLYKVLVGEFLNREAAGRLSEEINEKEKLAAFVTMI
ncbi:MAG: SPOR domain-containing protein [Nitrospirota bacterium]